MKKIIAVLIIASVFLSVFSVMSFAYKTKILKDINDDTAFVIDENRPDIIKINKASLYKNGQYFGMVYVIGLMGSDFSTDKANINCLQNCIRSGFSSNNSYLAELKKKATESIPQNSNIILIGHSLGGMIAQQFASDKEMKDRYNILNVVCMGSPYVITGKREGDIHRISDSGDAVPYLSPALITNAFLGNYEYECCGYFGDPGNAHIQSYLTSEKWAGYDCLGVKGGAASMRIYY